MKPLKKNQYIQFLTSKVFLSSSLGNVLEFYDFATYGFLIPVMSPLFFPAVNPVNSLLMAFGAFAISFLVRPLGGFLFGYLGDKYGRKIPFALSLIFMAIATSLIGTLPTFEQAGILSPLLLIFCRLIQGLCIGGEFSGSLIFATEHLEQRSQRGAFFTGSITAAGVGGWFLSLAICTLCLNLGYSYSWRIPFLVGAVVGIVGYYIRRSVPESPALLLGSSESIWKMIKVEWVTAGSIAGIGALMGGLFYGLHIFPNSFLPTHFPSISHAEALQCTTIGIGVYMISLPFMGVLADYIGHTRAMQIFSVTTILLSYPIICFLMAGGVYFIIISEILASILLAGFMAPATFVLAQSFLPAFRYRLVSFSYNLGASLLGGLTPGIFLFLTENLNLLYGPGIYLAVCGTIGFFSSYYLGMKNKLMRISLSIKERSSIIATS